MIVIIRANLKKLNKLTSTRTVATQQTISQSMGLRLSLLPRQWKKACQTLSQKSSKHIKNRIKTSQNLPKSKAILCLPNRGKLRLTHKTWKIKSGRKLWKYSKNTPFLRAGKLPSTQSKSSLWIVQNWTQKSARRKGSRTRENSGATWRSKNWLRRSKTTWRRSKCETRFSRNDFIGTTIRTSCPSISRLEPLWTMGASIVALGPHSPKNSRRNLLLPSFWWMMKQTDSRSVNMKTWMTNGGGWETKNKRC